MFECFSEMVCWVRMLVHTVDAEYPSFSLLNTLTVFNVSKVDGSSQDKKAALKRLSQVWGVEYESLVSEYDDHFPYAKRNIQLAPTLGSTAAWKAACRDTQSRKSTRANHPARALLHVLMRLSPALPYPLVANVLTL